MKVVSQLLFLFLLLGVLVTPTPVLGKLDNATISITFNETLKGFATTGGSPSDTIKDFEVAYIKGKLKGEVLAFSLHVNIKDVRTWLADPLHNALCTGTVEESAITNKTKVPVGPVPQGSLHIFDGGVLPSHQLMMEYSLPFKEEGKNYLLYGVKHIPGNNCLGLLTQITTLYVHVLDADAKYPKSTVLRSGIVKIGVGSIISLAASVRVHGGTVADKIRSFLQFGVLLLGDVIKNCIDRAAFETEFWYLWTSDGHTGVLIDLIKRPDTLELRLVQYTDGTSHSVTRQTLPLEDFSVGADNVTVHFGKSIVMGKNNLIGTIGGVEVNISFATGGRTNSFLPPELALLGLGAVLPNPVSQYDRSGWPVGGTVGKNKLAPSIPLVKTTYKIPYGLDLLNWVMISASQFTSEDGKTVSDLQIELVGMPIKILGLDLAWFTPSYIYYNGEEYKVDSIEGSSEFVKITHDGSLTHDNKHRLFGVEIQLPAALFGLIHASVNCSAPANQFAFLDQEGSTYIHTTVFGTCKAEMITMNKDGSVTANTFLSSGKNLLEIKA